MAGLVALLLAGSPQARAHQGPPFPIVMDRPAGPYVISVWADPDVGIGTFFVILAAPPGNSLPLENKVEIYVQPASGRLAESCYAAARQNVRDRLQYCAEVPFDRQEVWRVRVKVSGAQGSGEVTVEVEATPPGYGPWDLLIYGFPFLLFGALWLYAGLRRRNVKTGLQKAKHFSQ